MLKHYDFECASCSHTFDEYVEGTEGKPERCPRCEASVAFKKLPSSWSMMSKIIVDYPGSKRLKAGYQHTHNRPAEKKGTQVSMHVPKSAKT